jgi:acyl-CoA thioesterase
MDELDTARACAEAMYAGDSASRGLGIKIGEIAAGRAEATFGVSAAMLNGQGYCHGGMIFTLADSAFAFACNSYNDVSVASAASIEFVRPANEGDVLTATAAERSRGRRTGLYDVEVRNQRGEVVALFRGRSFATGVPMLRRPAPKPDT